MANKQNLKTAVDRRLQGVTVTENQLQQIIRLAQAQPRRKVRVRTLIIAFALVALLGTAIAVAWPATIGWISGMYGDDWANELKSGTLMPVRQTHVLGQVQYEWLEVIHVGEATEQATPYSYQENSLYGTVRITPTAGSNIVLIPEDTELSMFPGYNRHLGEIAPEGTASYLELANRSNAKIILAKAVPRGVLLDGELQEGYEIMYSYSSSPDGSLLYHFQIPNVNTDNAYTIQLRINNWEVTRDGEWLRDGPDSTWLKDDWVVTVSHPAKDV